MKTRRIIASALAFIMATTAAASSVFAAGETVKISASKAEAEIGGTFSIDISLSGVPSTAIKGCEFALKYDSSVLSITGVKAGEIANTGADSAESDISGEVPAFFEDHSKAGTITLTWATGLSDTGYWINKDGVFATVTGTVSTSATAGEYPIEIVPITRDDISGANNSIYVGYVDGNGTAVEYGTSVSNGAVVIAGKTTATEQTTTTEEPIKTTTTTEEPIKTTPTTTVTSNNQTTTTTQKPVTTTTNGGNDVTDVKYGDLNLDGAIGITDVVYMNKYIAKIISLNAQQIANADTLKDGNINPNDASVLMKYVVSKIDSLPQYAE